MTKPRASSRVYKKMLGPPPKPQTPEIVIAELESSFENCQKHDYFCYEVIVFTKKGIQVALGSRKAITKTITNKLLWFWKTEKQILDGVKTEDRDYLIDVFLEALEDQTYNHVVLIGWVTPDSHRSITSRTVSGGYLTPPRPSVNKI